MAAEYEIKEVGYIGSVWQGNFNNPVNVGKTIQISNIPNVIELGGIDPINLGRYRVATFFTEKENVDIQKLNNQLPDSSYYFEIGKLTTDVIEEIFLQSKIDKDFLQRQDVLYRYNNTRLKTTNYSLFPIQENWSFDTSNPNSVKYIYNNPSQTLQVNFVFLVSSQQLSRYTEYFSSIQQIETISDEPIIANPNSEDIIEYVDNQNNGNLFLPPLPPPPRPFVVPSIDQTLLATERAKELFDLNKSKYVITNITEFNEKLNEVNISQIGNQNAYDIRIQNGLQAAAFNILVQSIYYDNIRNFLYEQISLLEKVKTPAVEPDRWKIDDSGMVTITPVESSLPTNVVSTAIDDAKDLQEFDDLIDDLIEDLTIDENNVYAFKKITKVADYSLPILRYKTKGLFRCAGEKLSTFYTGSLTEKQQKYYLSVFNEQQYTDESYHQFDITYCHISGSGSSHIEGEVDLYPAKTMYRKYMLECFGHTNGKFPFKNGKNGDYFYAIQLDRNQFKEKLDLGNFELALCELSSSGIQSHGTSNRFFTLIDESKDSKQEIVTNEGIQEYYYVTSGSIRDGVYGEPEDDAWGIVFPKMGLIILDGVVLDQSCSFNTITGSTDGQNSKRFFLSISGAAVPTAYRPSGSFFARSFETHLTETYFCRADFNEFNHSTNYTYVSGSNGFLKYDYFTKDPHTYITTVGLYNKNKELLAIGKLRNPIQKNDGKVCIFEVVVRLN